MIQKLCTKWQSMVGHLSVKGVMTAVLLYLAGAGGAFSAESDNAVKNWQYYFPSAASDKAERMYWFHDYFVLPVLVIIPIFVLGLLVWVMVRYNEKSNPKPSKTTHHTLLEVVWTALPVLILGIIFIPSIRLLFLVEDTSKTEMTVKVTGNQWFWTYEYNDYPEIKFDSNIMQLADLKDEDKHLYRQKVDNPLVLPVGKKIKVLVTSSDVIHNWTMLPAGAKIDAVPGRVNETWVNFNKTGVFYGFCQKLCGVNHSFMPVEVRVVSQDEFNNWVQEQKKSAHLTPTSTNNALVVNAQTISLN